jgi:hypothetical protein
MPVSTRATAEFANAALTPEPLVVRLPVWKPTVTLALQGCLVKTVKDGSSVNDLTINMQFKELVSNEVTVELSAVPLGLLTSGQRNTGEELLTDIVYTGRDHAKTPAEAALLADISAVVFRHRQRKPFEQLRLQKIQLKPTNSTQSDGVDRRVKYSEDVPSTSRAAASHAGLESCTPATRSLLENMVVTVIVEASDSKTATSLSPMSNENVLTSKSMASLRAAAQKYWEGGPAALSLSSTESGHHTFKDYFHNMLRLSVPSTTDKNTLDGMLSALQELGTPFQKHLLLLSLRFDSWQMSERVKNLHSLLLTNPPAPPTSVLVGVQEVKNKVVTERPLHTYLKANKFDPSQMGTHPIGGISICASDSCGADSKVKGNPLHAMGSFKGTCLEWFPIDENLPDVEMFFNESHCEKNVIVKVNQIGEIQCDQVFNHKRYSSVEWTQEDELFIGVKNDNEKPWSNNLKKLVDTYNTILVKTCGNIAKLDKMKAELDKMKAEIVKLDQTNEKDETKKTKMGETKNKLTLKYEKFDEDEFHRKEKLQKSGYKTDKSDIEAQIQIINNRISVRKAEEQKVTQGEEFYSISSIEGKNVVLRGKGMPDLKFVNLPTVPRGLERFFKSIKGVVEVFSAGRERRHREWATEMRSQVLSNVDDAECFRRKLQPDGSIGSEKHLGIDDLGIFERQRAKLYTTFDILKNRETPTGKSQVMPRSSKECVLKCLSSFNNSTEHVREALPELMNALNQILNEGLSQQVVQFDAAHQAARWLNDWCKPNGFSQTQYKIEYFKARGHLFAKTGKPSVQSFRQVFVAEFEKYMQKHKWLKLGEKVFDEDSPGHDDGQNCPLISRGILDIAKLDELRKLVKDSNAKGFKKDLPALFTKEDEGTFIKVDFVYFTLKSGNAECEISHKGQQHTVYFEASNLSQMEDEFAKKAAEGPWKIVSVRDNGTVQLEEISVGHLAASPEMTAASAPRQKQQKQEDGGLLQKMLFGRDLCERLEGALKDSA